MRSAHQSQQCSQCALCRSTFDDNRITVLYPINLIRPNLLLLSLKLSDCFQPPAHRRPIELASSSYSSACQIQCLTIKMAALSKK